MLSVVSGGLATPLVGEAVGSGVIVGVAVAVSVGVAVGVAVEVAVGLGVGVMVDVGFGGMEVGLGRVGIKVGKDAGRANAIIPIAINNRHSNKTRTARILNCSQVRFKKGFFGLSGDLGIQEPSTCRILSNKVNQNCYLPYSGCR